MKKYLSAALLALSIYLNPHTVIAGDTVAHKYPRVVLVQLRSEHNRIEALTRQNKYAELEKVKQAAVYVQNCMIGDFTENFHYCPVYYYMDTNANYVLQQHFDGILFYADKSPVHDVSIVGSGHDYVIAYYGYPTTAKEATKVAKDPHKYDVNSGDVFGKGLVITNAKLQQIAFVYKFGYQNWTFRLGKRKKYVYFSKKYDIEYFPMAKWFDERLNERMRHHRKATPLLDFLNGE